MRFKILSFLSLDPFPWLRPAPIIHWWLARVQFLPAPVPHHADSMWLFHLSPRLLPTRLCSSSSSYTSCSSQNTPQGDELPELRQIIPPQGPPPQSSHHARVSALVFAFAFALRRIFCLSRIARFLPLASVRPSRLHLVPSPVAELGGVSVSYPSYAPPPRRAIAPPRLDPGTVSPMSPAVQRFHGGHLLPLRLEPGSRSSQAASTCTGRAGPAA